MPSVNSNLKLAALDLTAATDYAVSLRYDIEFWPDKATAEETVTLANEFLKSLVLPWGNNLKNL